MINDPLYYSSMLEMNFLKPIIHISATDEGVIYIEKVKINNWKGIENRGINDKWDEYSIIADTIIKLNNSKNG